MYVTIVFSFTVPLLVSHAIWGAEIGGKNCGTAVGREAASVGGDLICLLGLLS